MLVEALTLVALSGAALSDDPCEDKVNNVINVTDCQTKGGFAHFEDLQILTYDASGKPACAKNKKGHLMGQVHLPGELLIYSGKVERKWWTGSGGLKVTIDANAPNVEGSFLALTLVKLGAWFSDKLCDSGKPVISAAKPICQLDFCHIIGPALCQKLDQHGTFTIQDLPAEDRQSIKLPELKGVLAFLKPILNGDWKLGGQIQLGKVFDACIVNNDIPFST